MRTKNHKNARVKVCTFMMVPKVKGITVQFKTGKRLKTFKDFNITVQGNRLYGKCYEISFSNNFENVFFVDIIPRMSVNIYLNLPHQFWNLDSKSKIQAKSGKTLFLDVSYDIFRSNFDEKCKNYEHFQENYETNANTIAEIETKTNIEYIGLNIDFSKVSSAAITFFCLTVLMFYIVPNRSLSNIYKVNDKIWW